MKITPKCVVPAHSRSTGVSFPFSVRKRFRFIDDGTAHVRVDATQRSFSDRGSNTHHTTHLLLHCTLVHFGARNDTSRALYSLPFFEGGWEIHPTDQTDHWRGVPSIRSNTNEQEQQALPINNACCKGGVLANGSLTNTRIHAHTRTIQIAGLPLCAGSESFTFNLWTYKSIGNGPPAVPPRFIHRFADFS